LIESLPGLFATNVVVFWLDLEVISPQSTHVRFVEKLVFRWLHSGNTDRQRKSP
jgi:hypothetical protein